MKEIVIVKAGGTNFASIEDAMDRLGCKVFYAHNEKDIINAAKVLIPGVGSINASAESIASLKDVVKNLKQPVLGICLGMQMLFEKSQENLEVGGFSVINEQIVHLPNDVTAPHTGWNKLIFQNKQSIFAEIPSGYVYFTHSYYAPFGEYTQSYCEYGNYKISAIVQKENFYGFQFHPERSGSYGLELLKQFIQKA